MGLYGELHGQELELDRSGYAVDFEVESRRTMTVWANMESQLLCSVSPSVNLTIA